MSNKWSTAAPGVEKPPAPIPKPNEDEIAAKRRAYRERLAMKEDMAANEVETLSKKQIARAERSRSKSKNAAGQEPQPPSTADHYVSVTDIKG